MKRFKIVWVERHVAVVDVPSEDFALEEALTQNKEETCVARSVEEITEGLLDQEPEDLEDR